jgi:hypothetical protein
MKDLWRKLKLAATKIILGPEAVEKVNILRLTSNSYYYPYEDPKQ